MTRGLAEIARLGGTMGGQPKTFMGLAGMGDLLLTCTGDFWRNRKVGLALAEGKKLPQILAILVAWPRASVLRAKWRDWPGIGIEMPITQAVNAILHRDVPAGAAVEKLLSRDPKLETQ